MAQVARTFMSSTGCVLETHVGTRNVTGIVAVMGMRLVGMQMFISAGDCVGTSRTFGPLARRVLDPSRLETCVTV